MDDAGETVARHSDQVETNIARLNGGLAESMTEVSNVLD
jgi:hypothetical protein